MLCIACPEEDCSIVVETIGKNILLCHCWYNKNKHTYYTNSNNDRLLLALKEVQGMNEMCTLK